MEIRRQGLGKGLVKIVVVIAMPKPMFKSFRACPASRTKVRWSVKGKMSFHSSPLTSSKKRGTTFNKGHGTNGGKVDTILHTVKIFAAAGSFRPPGRAPEKFAKVVFPCAFRNAGVIREGENIRTGTKCQGIAPSEIEDARVATELDQSKRTSFGPKTLVP